MAAGAPEDLAARVALLRPLTSATDIVDIAADNHRDTDVAAAVYHSVGEAFRFDEMRAAAGEVALPHHWDRLATRRIIEALMGQQQALARRILDALPTGATAEEAVTAVQTWKATHATAHARLDRSHNEVVTSGPWSFAKLGLVGDALRDFLAMTA
jgi:glutamate dehydrogenase